MLLASVVSWELEAGGLQLGPGGLPSHGCSERVSFVLRFVRANAGREEAQRSPAP